MSLKELVDYFNTKFEREHHCEFQPFLLKNDQVLGTFGVAKLKTEFIPIKRFCNNGGIVGFATKTIASTDEVQKIKIFNLKKLARKSWNNSLHIPSEVSFDRLCRTVHLLNYLALAKESNFLMTEVDPQHILGLSYNHGLYFEEVISYAGLKINEVIISINVNAIQLNYPKLLQGLHNYRRRGYPIALNIGHLNATNPMLLFALEFIKIFSPEYIIVRSYTMNNEVVKLFNTLKDLMKDSGGKIILQGTEKGNQRFIIEMAELMPELYSMNS